MLSLGFLNPAFSSSGSFGGRGQHCVHCSAEPSSLASDRRLGTMAFAAWLRCGWWRNRQLWLPPPESASKHMDLEAGPFYLGSHSTWGGDLACKHHRG